MNNRIRTVAVVGMISLLHSWGAAWAHDTSESREGFTVQRVTSSASQQSTHVPNLDCGYRSPEEWLAELHGAVARGEIPDPAARSLPSIQPGKPQTAPVEMPSLTPEHIFTFEDTDQLLLTNFSNGELIDLMTTAANGLLG
jgi:hypothetical protein